MNQTLKTLDVETTAAASYSDAALRVVQAVAALQDGRGVIVIDEPDRENEGDMVFAASTLTVPQMALMIREGSGIVCLVLPQETCQSLDLPPMVQQNSSAFGTGFTVSIEAKRGVTSGVSAADRVTTIQAAIAAGAQPDDLARPGHVFPLAARPGGLKERHGHTEATLDLLQRAGLPHYGVLCEVTNPDGSMAKGQRLVDFADRHHMPVVTIADLLAVG